jgi:plasmid stabilization system protein ParE
VTIKFTFSADAQRMLDAADERWISEHGYSDNPLFDQIEHARDLLLDNPELGIKIPQGGRLRGVVRRMLLGSSWHLYYRYDDEKQLIEILAVWFAPRGSAPPL